MKFQMVSEFVTPRINQKLWYWLCEIGMHVSVFISKLGIIYAVCIRWIDETWWKIDYWWLSNCYQVVALVATSRRCDGAIVMSYTEINKAVSQWPLTFNLCVTDTLNMHTHKHTHTWNHWYALGYVWQRTQTGGQAPSFLSWLVRQYHCTSPVIDHVVVMAITGTIIHLSNLNWSKINAIPLEIA